MHAQRKAIRRMKSFDGFSRYYHPNQWAIRKCKRDWSLRGFERGALGGAAASAPLYWWEVRPYATKTVGGGAAYTAESLGEARAWCDAHVWRNGRAVEA